MRQSMDKLRVLVMHGQRVLERMQGQTWETVDVKAEMAITPGIYNIFNAKIADTNAAHTGMVIHTDDDFVYQAVQKNVYVRHAAAAFEQLPELGSTISIGYESGRAKITNVAPQVRRGLSR
jgi:hypothetical protein